jgi:hypothetical protein
MVRLRRDPRKLRKEVLDLAISGLSSLFQSDFPTHLHPCAPIAPTLSPSALTLWTPTR